MAKDLEIPIILPKPKLIKLVTHNNNPLPLQLDITDGRFIINQTITTLTGQIKFVLIPDINHDKIESNDSIQIILVSNFTFRILKNKRFLSGETIYLLSHNQKMLETLTIICKISHKSNNIFTTSKLNNYKILQIDEWDYSFNDS